MSQLERPRLFRAPGYRYNPARDHFLFEVIGKARFASQDLIEQVVFGHSVNPSDLAEDRLSKMARAGLVRRFAVPHARHPYWVLGRLGVELARELGVPGAEAFAALSAPPVHDLAHLDALNRFRFALAFAAGREGIRLAAFWNDALLRRRIGRPTTVLRLVPDALVILERPGAELVLALEVDLGTERIRTLAAKAAAYLHALRTGGIFGLRPGVVVFLLPPGARLTRAAGAIAALGARQRFLVGPLPEPSGPLAMPLVRFAEALGPEESEALSFFDLAVGAWRTSPLPGEVRTAEAAEMFDGAPVPQVGELR